MKNIVILATYSLLCSGISFAQDKVILTESLIKELSSKSNPTYSQIEASFLNEKLNQSMREEGYDLTLDGSGHINKSSERLLGQFDGGVTTRSSIYALDLMKKTKYGVNVGVGAFANKVSNAFISDAATNGLSVSLSVDIFKNFLGRNTKNDLEQSALRVRRAQLEKETSEKTFEINMRKVYWQLVANSEQKKLIASMVKLAQEQLIEAQKREKSGAADAGEVAKYHSVLSTRQANLLSLQYGKSQAIQNLKEYLPELNGKTIELGAYDTNDILSRVLACSNVISNYKEAPLELTNYDEIVDLLNQEEKLESKLNKSYDDIDVRLEGSYSSVGRDFGLGDARENLFDDPKGRTSIGVVVSIPLGGKKQATAEIKKKLAKVRYDSEVRAKLSKVDAFHSETSEIIGVLRKVVRNQKETNKYLEQNLKVVNKKYKQARISIQDLISEQDALLQSKYNEIETNLAIINTLLDYFSIYPEVPCEFNRI